MLTTLSDESERRTSPSESVGQRFGRGAGHGGWWLGVRVVVLALLMVAGSATVVAADDGEVTFDHARVVLHERDTYVPNGVGHADFVHRLYAGLLLRTPDETGWSYWVSMLDTGRTTRQDVVDGFVRSEEFRIRFGTDDAAVIRNLYLNTLGREPDRAGYDYWLGELAVIVVGDIVTLFLDSDENLRRMRDQGPVRVPITELPTRFVGTRGTTQFDWPETIRIDDNPGTFRLLEVPEYELPPFTAVYGGDCHFPGTGADVGGVANIWLNSTDIVPANDDTVWTSPDREDFWRIACVDTVEPGDYDWSIAHEVAHLWQPVIMGAQAYNNAAWPDPIERIADCVKVHYGGVAAYGLGPCPDTNLDELIVERMTPRP